MQDKASNPSIHGSTQPTKLGIGFTKSSSDEINQSGPGWMTYLQSTRGMVRRRGMENGPTVGGARRLLQSRLAGTTGAIREPYILFFFEQQFRELYYTGRRSPKFSAARAWAGPLRSLRIGQVTLDAPWFRAWAISSAANSAPLAGSSRS